MKGPPPERTEEQTERWRRKIQKERVDRAAALIASEIELDSLRSDLQQWLEDRLLRLSVDYSYPHDLLLQKRDDYEVNLGQSFGKETR